MGEPMPNDREQLESAHGCHRQIRDNQIGQSTSKFCGAAKPLDAVRTSYPLPLSMAADVVRIDRSSSTTRMRYANPSGMGGAPVPKRQLLAQQDGFPSKF